MPIDSSGRFTEVVKEFAGQYVKDADKNIKKDLKDRNRLIEERQILHSYPFCYRSETPLIYKAHHSWFIEVTKLKSDLLVNNQKAYWVP
jgi:isoleucyl-tRNA synthetase